MNNPTNQQSLPSDNNNNYNHNILHTTLNIATNNIISFSDYTKRIQIINEAYLNHIDILGLSETNISSKQSSYIKKEISSKYIPFFNNDSSKFKPKGSGVGILVKPHLAPYITSHKGKQGRYIYVDFTFKHQIGRAYV